MKVAIELAVGVKRLRRRFWTKVRDFAMPRANPINVVVSLDGVEMARRVSEGLDRKADANRWTS